MIGKEYKNLQIYIGDLDSMISAGFGEDIHDRVYSHAVGMGYNVDDIDMNKNWLHFKSDGSVVGSDVYVDGAKWLYLDKFLDIVILGINFPNFHVRVRNKSIIKSVLAHGTSLGYSFNGNYLDDDIDSGVISFLGSGKLEFSKNLILGGVSLELTDVLNSKTIEELFEVYNVKRKL